MKQKRLTKKIDSRTLGGNQAGINLVEMLNERYPQLISKVSAYYHKFNDHLTSLIYSQKHFIHKGVLVQIMHLYRDYKLNIVKNSTLPDEVKSHLLNIMCASFGDKVKIMRKGIIYDRSGKYQKKERS